MTTAPARAPTVLVVNDREDARTVFLRLMAARGYLVAEATDGEAAVEAARRVLPDLILLDLNMPRPDGLVAAQRIRELKGACERVVIIAVTAFDAYGIKEVALEAGCDACLTRPVDLNELDHTLGRLLPPRF